MKRLPIACLAAAALACGSGSGGAPMAAPADVTCAGIFCGASPPPVTIRVVDAVTSGPVAGVGLAVTASPPSGAFWPATCSTPPGPTECHVNGPGPGTYRFDVSAPGYATAHVEVEVAPSGAPPGACCAISYVPQTVDVRLTPAG